MKKLYLLLSVMALFIIMANCTPAGAELGLVGTWEYSSTDSWDSGYEEYTNTLTIKDDDSIKMIYTNRSYDSNNNLVYNNSDSSSGKITSADSSLKRITIKWDNSGVKQTIAYSLSADGKELILGFQTFKKK